MPRIPFVLALPLAAISACEAEPDEVEVAVRVFDLTTGKNEFTVPVQDALVVFRGQEEFTDADGFAFVTVDAGQPFTIEVTGPPDAVPGDSEWVESRWTGWAGFDHLNYPMGLVDRGTMAGVYGTIGAAWNDGYEGAPYSETNPYTPSRPITPEMVEAARTGLLSTGFVTLGVNRVPVPERPVPGITGVTGRLTPDSSAFSFVEVNEDGTDSTYVPGTTLQKWSNGFINFIDVPPGKATASVGDRCAPYPLGDVDAELELKVEANVWTVGFLECPEPE